MNGTKYVFDTNALINYFKGDPGLQDYHHAALALSIVSVIEFLSYPNINEAGKNLLLSFLQQVQVVDLKADDKELLEHITSIRRLYKLKLPDAIVAATALQSKAILVTTDRDFEKIASLRVNTY